MKLLLKLVLVEQNFWFREKGCGRRNRGSVCWHIIQVPSARWQLLPVGMWPSKLDDSVLLSDRTRSPPPLIVCVCVCASLYNRNTEMIACFSVPLFSSVSLFLGFFLFCFFFRIYFPLLLSLWPKARTGRPLGSIPAPVWFVPSCLKAND